jgi:hypothetical protein
VEKIFAETGVSCRVFFLRRGRVVEMGGLDDLMNIVNFRFVADVRQDCEAGWG